MKINCEIEKISTLKKGDIKIILHVDKGDKKGVLKSLENFMDKPITAELLVNEEEQIKKLQKISPEMRKKIYAVMRDIAVTTQGTDDPESVKDFLKREFDRGEFSLADCDKEIARDFLEFLLSFAFQHGVELKEHPREAFDDIERFIDLCLAMEICTICGKEADIHHIDTIGMGRDRTKVDDSEYRKMALCRIHHSELHQIGWEKFSVKYYLEEEANDNE